MISLFFILTIFLEYLTISSGDKPHYIPIVIDGNYEHNYTLTLNSTIEYIFDFRKTDFFHPSRVNVHSNDASRDYPVLVVVRQQKEVLSWQVPLLVNTKAGFLEFYNTSRTLCPDNMDVISLLTTEDISNGTNENVTNAVVSISTASPENISVTLHMGVEENFYIARSQVYKTTLLPSKPKIFFYKFDMDQVSSDPSTVLLRVDSDDDVCVLISIQNSSCPVYDLERDMRFASFWETATGLASVTISRSKFPNGFFIVFVSAGDDYECTGRLSSGVIHREKLIRFSVFPSISYTDYVTAVLATVGALVAFHLTFWVCQCVCARGAPLTLESVRQDFEERQDICTPTSEIPELENDSSSMDETEYDTITEADSERHFYRSKSAVCLSDLARKDSRILKRKSYLYLWHVLTVAVFYGLPVVQLVITNQRVLADTGNLDLCYYNGLCAHPLGLLTDFNHVFSNIGYALLGVLCLLITRRRERMHTDATFDKCYGIPQHYGLFYAMGVALIMEGVLSASYHVCPNHSNFQFDSSFMYVMAVLCMVKLYQNRHPDINATAYATFGVLAAVICLGMIGILDGTVYFWAIFTFIHLFACLLLTVQIYYMGCWKFDRGVLIRAYRTFANDFRSGPVNILKPVYKGRMVLMVLGNVCNWGLAVLGLYHHDRDFGTYLLAIFMANTLLYTIFYIVMKLCHRELIARHAVVFIVLTFATWSTAMYFFVHKSISWALTPAQSRQYNQPCLLLDFYDPHDIWHFLSGAAMFFSFMVLLTLDDDLTYTHRSKINVF